eukprot:scaffold5485_cov247-Chaetoceros_neogracile.AAC.2
MEGRGKKGTSPLQTTDQTPDQPPITNIPHFTPSCYLLSHEAYYHNERHMSQNLNHLFSLLA